MISCKLDEALPLLAATVGLGAALGCVCPPCPTAPGSNGPAANGGPAPAANVAAGSKLIIWNGDGESAGGTAQAWADCDKKPNCKSVLKPESGAGKDSSTSLKFHGEGEGWIGGGWNWFGWYPETAGVDISGYTNLTFWLRMEAKSAQQAPDPSAITVSLVCSNGKKGSASASLEKYARGLADGKWHRVVVPLAEFYKGREGAMFDPHTAWEFVVGTWSGSPKDFNLYFDDITVEKL